MSETFQYRKAYATYVIAAVNALVFLLARVQGEEATLRMYRGVAVSVPQDFNAIGWWKLLAANFAHLDTTHLLINVLAICVFGPVLEFAMGRKKYVILYLVAGFVSLLMLLVYSWFFNLYVPSQSNDPAHPQITAGASSCLMAIAGGRAAIFLRMWFREGSGLARNHYFYMVLVVLLQAYVDMQLLTVSFGGHLTGAMVGFVLALLLGHYRLDLSGANPFSLAGASRQPRGDSPAGERGQEVSLTSH